jgi:hypothetical protein
MSAPTTPRRKVATSLRRIPVITLSYSHEMLDCGRVERYAGDLSWQVLQPVRPAMPDRPGDRLAVAVVSSISSPCTIWPQDCRVSRRGKAPGHPPQQVCQQRGPGIIGYRGSSDCRVLVVSHKPVMIAAAAPTRASA